MEKNINTTIAVNQNFRNELKDWCNQRGLIMGFVIEKAVKKYMEENNENNKVQMGF
jgi:hypothetical protein